MYARLSTFDFRCHNSSLNVSDCCGVRLCSIEFDYVRLLDRSTTERLIAFDLQNFLGEFDSVRLRNVRLATPGVNALSSKNVEKSRNQTHT